MRHRKKGRVLGRSPSHRKALLRNLASSLFLTERDAEFDSNTPKVKGRIVTTLQKAKEVRPLVEKCVTIARRSLQSAEEAAQYAANSDDRNSEDWREWRTSENWQKWVQARSPVVAARRRVLQLIGDKQAVGVLFDDIAPRFEDRDGGYTRVLRLAQPRLGDAGARAILEFVGTHDRVVKRSEKPVFSDDEDLEQTSPDETSAEDIVDVSSEMAESEESDGGEQSEQQED
ncbi:MAG: 50S ribosomal protein L17 [Planctomycetaceae bacterium]|nr:50S ribosomal protein L17 [Planctomycetaceae bacterium]